MKKIISITLSVLLLISLVFSAAATPVFATENTDADTAVLPRMVDMWGKEINLPHTSDYIPSSVAKGNGISLSENVTDLPLQTLFSFNASTGTNTDIKVEGSQGKGVMFYVKMPESLNGEITRLCLYLIITDAQTGYTERIRYQWGYVNWYSLAKGSGAWKAEYITNYGIPLAGGFEGFVYIPANAVTLGSDAVDDNPNMGIDSDDIITGVQFQTVGGDMLSEGSMTADSVITVSAPILIKGDVSDPSLPDTRKLVAGGEEIYLWDYYKPYTGSAAYSAFGTPDGSFVVNKGDSSAVMTEIEGIPPLLDTPSYQFSGITNEGVRTFFSDTTQPDDALSCGVVFYVETTLKDPEFTFYFSTSEASSQTSYGYGSFYYLREGDTSWKATGGGRIQGGATDDWRRRILSDDGFKGYIYHPFSGDISYASFESGHFTGASVHIHSNATDNGEVKWLDKDGNEAVIKISNPLVVTSFNENSSLVTLDGGALYDPFTGEVQDGSVDNYAPDTFIGNEALVNSGNLENLLSLELGSDPERIKNGVTTGANGSGAFYGDVDNGFAYSLTNNNTVFKESLLRVTSTNNDKKIAQNIATLLFKKMDASQYDGYMLYMRNDSDTDLYFALQPYPKKEDGNTLSWAQVTRSSLPFLTQNDGKWEWSYIPKVTDMYYTYCLPAGQGGFLYLTEDDDCLGGGASYNELVIRSAEDRNTDLYYTAKCDFVVSSPIFVKNYSDKNAGIALVNGGSIAQDLLSGDFACQNDYNGDLSVNILDLVRGKAKNADITEFRNSYLTVYAK